MHQNRWISARAPLGLNETFEIQYAMTNPNFVPRQRPLVLIALFWMLGIALCKEFVAPSDVQLLMICSGALFIGSVALFWFNKPSGLWALLILVASLGALREAESRLPLDDLYAALDKITPVRGLIEEYPSVQQDRTSFVIKPENLPGKIQIFYYHPQGSFEDLRYGDEVELLVPLQIPWESGDFDYKQYLLSRDIWAIGTTWTARDIQVLSRKNGSPLIQWGHNRRNELVELIEQQLPEPASSLLKSLLLGDRGSLEDEIESDFRDAGVLHVMAVSGLNIAILIAPFLLIFRSFRLSWTTTYILLVPLVLGYLILVGFKVSLVRATLMFGFMALGWVLAERGLILKRWIDPLQGLALAALVILILTPEALYDVSFQLSFAATAGIVIGLEYLTPKFQEWRDRIEFNWFADQSLVKRVSLQALQSLFVLIAVSLAAQIAVAPLLAIHFHRVYLVTLLANLIIVPMATIAIWGGLVLVVAALIFPEVGVVLSGVETEMLTALTTSTSFFAHIPAGFVAIDPGALSTILVALPVIASAGLTLRR